MLIVPPLVIVPVKPPWARIPAMLFALLIEIDPWLVTLLLLLIVTAVAAVGLIEPLDVMTTSLGLPLLAVAVNTGVVWEAEILTCA